MIRLLGGAVPAGVTPIFLPSSLVIDGNTTTIQSSGSPIFRVMSSNTATIENVRMSSPMANVLVSVGGSATMRLVDTRFDGGQVAADGGMVEINRSQFINSSVDCRNGAIVARHTRFDRSPITTQFCRLDLQSNRIGPGNESILVNGGGVITIENNVFVEVLEGSSIVWLNSHGAGSKFRFNTIHNSSQVTSSAPALFCASGAGIDVTSNIFASNSSEPLFGCTARYSLFDQPGAAAASTDMTNVVGETSLFFKSPTTGDYRLQASSPAHGIAEPNLVGTDHDGNARPSPAGSKPDAGAFEAP